MPAVRLIAEIVALLAGLFAATQQFLLFDTWWRLAFVVLFVALMMFLLARSLADWAAPRRDGSGHERPTRVRIGISMAALLLVAAMGDGAALWIVETSTVRAFTDGERLLVHAANQPVTVTVAVPPGNACQPGTPVGARRANGRFATEGTTVQQFIADNFGAGQAFSLTCAGTAVTLEDRDITTTASPVPPLFSEAMLRTAYWLFGLGGLVLWVFGTYCFVSLLRARRYAPGRA